MVIKKPYAFLIKKFRLIHAILFVTQIYLIVRTTSIYSFFNGYANNLYYSNSIDLVTSYLTSYMFVITFLIVCFNAIIYYLLQVKNKPNKFYFFSIIYYIILFIYLVVMLNIFQGLESESLGIETVRAIRDISVIVLVPQVLFVFMNAGRALGFNIKQFDFKKDMSELEIDATDYEEVEVNLGKNNYKYARTARKNLRYLKYFILENKFYVVVITSLICFSITIVVFLKLRVYSVEYNQNQQILANSLWYTASDAYITNEDVYGKVIDNDRYFLIVKIKVDNKSTSDIFMDRNTFRSVIKKELKVPNMTIGDKFIDVGTLFTTGTLTSGSSKEYIVIFDLTKDEIYKEYSIRIKNTNRALLGDLSSEYKDVIVKPINLISENDLGSYYLPNEVKFDKTILGDTSLLVSSYAVGDDFKEKYSNCSNDSCYDGTYIIKPTIVNKKELSVLKIKATVSTKKDSYTRSFIKYPSDLFKYYVKVKYRYQGETIEETANIIENKFEPEKYTYLEVPSTIKEANKIQLLFDIRGIKYTFVLK